MNGRLAMVEEQEDGKKGEKGLNRLNRLYARKAAPPNSADNTEHAI